MPRSKGGEAGRGQRGVMTIDSTGLVHRFVDEAWNKRNLAVLDEVLAAEYVVHDPAVPTVTGAEDLKQFIAAFLTAFPDLAVTVEECFAAADTVAVRWTARGTQKGPFLGIAPTEQPVVVAGMAIHHIGGGRIAESWVHWDSAGLVQQVSSVLPTESAKGA